MSNLLIWIATLITVVAVVTGLARWVSKRSRSLRNVVTFVMAAGSSYCASFVVDMWAQAALGNIPPANVIMPSVTWLLFAVVLAGGAFTARGSAYAIGLPFVFNALLALAVSGVHVQNLIVGLVLLLLAFIAILLRRKMEPTRSSGTTIALDH